MQYFADGNLNSVFIENVHQAMWTAEPRFSFNFFDKANETLRNAYIEVTSADDSDICNLGSINMGQVENIRKLFEVIDLKSRFLICGTLKAKLPYDKIEPTRAKNRRLGLSLMGMHEWLIQRYEKHEVTTELHNWLSVYKGVSNKISKATANRLSISRPVANRAIAPTGSIGILAGSSSGLEPLFAVSYKRR